HRLGHRAPEGAISRFGEGMDSSPPNGSNISIVPDGGDLIVVIPIVVTRPAGCTVVVAAIWLCGAVPLGVRAISALAAGNISTSAFFMLVVLALGTMLTAYTVYRGLRPPVPETLVLRQEGVRYDSGFVPLKQVGRNVDFPKRVRADLDLR